MPLCIDLYCGLGGWTEGFLAEGWDVIGFDIERHRYLSNVSAEPLDGGAIHIHADFDQYPAQLVLQDVVTLHGGQFRNADCIVASPPCQEFSYMAMPWGRAKRIAEALRKHPEGDCICPEFCDCEDYDCGLVSVLCPIHNDMPDSYDDCPALLHRNGAIGRDSKFPEGYTGSRTVAQLTALFDACFRIHQEACEAAGRYIPMVVENVKGAQPWVGKAKANFGSFYFWGDVDMVGGRVVAGGVRFGDTVRAAKRGQKRNPDGTEHPQGSWFAVADSKERGGRKGPGGDWFEDGRQGQDACAEGLKVAGFNFHHFEKTGEPGGSFQTAAVKVASEPGRHTDVGNGARFTSRDCGIEKGFAKEWRDSPNGMPMMSSQSPARKAASAQIAKIPFPLSSYIARALKPQALRETP